MMPKTVFGFDKSGGLPMVCIHTFEASADKQLVHLIDGNLRATVPPEGWESYCKTWPEAQDIVDALTIKPAALDVDASLAAAAAAGVAAAVAQAGAPL